MVELIFSDEQARILREAGQVIYLRDPKGNMIGRAIPNSVADPRAEISEEEIAAAKRSAKSAGPWFTTQEVLDSLRHQES